MWNASYFAAFYFAPVFWPEVGMDAPVVIQTTDGSPRMFAVIPTLGSPRMFEVAMAAASPRMFAAAQAGTPRMFKVRSTVVVVNTFDEHPDLFDDAQGSFDEAHS